MMRLIAFVIILSVREVLGKESIAPTAPTAPTTAPTTAEPTSPTAIPTAAPSDAYDFVVRPVTILLLLTALHAGLTILQLYE